MEPRFCEVICRAIGGNKISGTASVYYGGEPNQTYHLYGNTYERIERGAFDDVLSGDVLATYDHDKSKILGRTPNSLILRSDDEGLHYEINLPNTQYARDVYELVERGDVRGSSFIGHIKERVWIREGDKQIQVIKKFASLLDVCPTPTPVSSATNSVVRSHSFIKQLEEDKQRFFENELRTSRAKFLLGLE